MAASKTVLYGFYKSSATWRVRIALALKGLEYEKSAIDLEKGAHQSKDYLTLNPMGFVPTLFIDGVYLTQSLPILEYLEERNPMPALLPQDSAGRAKVRAMAEVVNSGIQPLQNPYVIARLPDTPNGPKKDWGNFYCSRGLAALEKMLQETAGKYSYRDQVTIADLCLVPQVFNAVTRFSVNLDTYPVVKRVYETLMTIPEFKVADPRRQPDTPEDQRIN